MRNQKGITLISLVITIIVLLILAAVSIGLLLGENGILTRAGEASKETVVAEAEEMINLELYAVYSSVLSNRLSVTDLERAIDNLNGTDNDVTTDDVANLRMLESDGTTEVTIANLKLDSSASGAQSISDIATITITGVADYKGEDVSGLVGTINVSTSGDTMSPADKD